MKMFKLVFVLVGIGLQWSSPCHAENVALGKPVSLIGAFGTGSGYMNPNNLPPLPSASIVTDGAFQGGGWTNGVWWDEQYSGVHSTVNIDLSGRYVLNAFTVMADNNDRYLLEYHAPTGDWTPFWEIPDVGGFGLTMRTTTLSAPITADALRLSAFPPIHNGMDYAYSVSEIQAIGFAAPAAVPEPSPLLLMSSGLVGGYLFLRRHRKG